MKYWGYLAVKLLAAGGIAYALLLAIQKWTPQPDPQLLDIRPDPFAHDLAFTFLMLLYFLVCLVTVDQRYRCRAGCVQ